MKLAVALAALFLYTSQAAEEPLLAQLRGKKVPTLAQHLTGQELVDYINKQQKLFKASLGTRFRGLSLGEKKKRVNGLNLTVKQLGQTTKANLAESRFLSVDIPESFDARTQWPNCPSISYIRDQSDCGSCWAFGAAEVISDRICIASEGKNVVEVSAEDIMSCCGFSCGFGCNGGNPSGAFNFWVRKGVVSGGNYDEKSGCMPYPFPPCEHHVNGTHYKKCPDDMYKTPKCEQKCQDGYSAKYSDDKFYGKSSFGIGSSVEDIQKEIMTNGPVEAAFSVYEDFEHYSGGVYTHTAGSYLGGHAVRVLGWGKENNVPYWLVANSWNQDWGEKGYFKIIRGINDCGFEEAMVAGLPKV